MGLLLESPIQKDLIIYQGGTFRLSDVLYSSDNLSVPLDLAGCSAIAEIWESYEDTSPLVHWNTDAADTAITVGATLTLGGAGGTLVVDLSDEATALLSRLNNHAHWYLTLTWPDGDTTWLYAGSVKIAQKKERTP